MFFCFIESKKNLKEKIWSNESSLNRRDGKKASFAEKFIYRKKIWINRMSLSLILNLSNEIFHYYEIE